MAKVSIYLNFAGNTEEAFLFYKAVFGTEFTAPIMHRGDAPPRPGAPALTGSEAKAVMHVSLPILGGTLIMGTDLPEGYTLTVGNNVTISLEPDTKGEADKLFSALSQGGTDIAMMRDEFWGYWGCCCDRFGIRWMFNVMSQPA